MRAWLLSSHWRHPSCSTGRAHSSVPLCCPTLCRTGGVSVRAPRPPTLACKTGRTTPLAGPRSTRLDLCPAGAPCTGASHGQRGCNGWAEPVPPRGLQTHVLRRAPDSPARASALRICSRPGGDNNPSCPCAAALCPPGNGSALPAGPLLAPRDGRGQCRPSWGGPLVAGMGMRSSGRPVGTPSPRTTGRLPLLSRDAPRRQGPQEAPFRQACSPRADAPCLLARPPPAGPPDSEAHCLPLDWAGRPRAARPRRRGCPAAGGAPLCTGLTGMQRSRGGYPGVGRPYRGLSVRASRPDPDGWAHCTPLCACSCTGLGRLPLCSCPPGSRLCRRLPAVLTAPSSPPCCGSAPCCDCRIRCRSPIHGTCSIPARPGPAPASACCAGRAPLSRPLCPEHPPSFGPFQAPHRSLLVTMSLAKWDVCTPPALLLALLSGPPRRFFWGWSSPDPTCLFSCEGPGLLACLGLFSQARALGESVWNGRRQLFIFLRGL